MEITESLKTEHRILEKILGAMDSLVEALQRNYDVPVEIIREIVELVKEYGDQYHNYKEENLLFPFISELGANGLRASIQKCSEEHSLNRGYYRSILKGAEKIAAGDASGKKIVIDAAKSFSTALRRHIQKEDRGLFPAVEKRLKESQKRRLWEMLEEYEDSRLGQPDLDAFEARARQLVIRISDVLSGVRV